MYPYKRRTTKFKTLTGNADEKEFLNAEELERAEARASFNKRRLQRANKENLSLGAFVGFS